MAPIGIAINGMLREEERGDSAWGASRAPLRWDAQALLAYALTPATHEEIACFAQAHCWPGRRWSPRAVRSAIGAARHELMRRIGLAR